MSQSLERRLGLVERLKLRLHLLVCTWCARYFKQIKFLRRLVQQRTLTAAPYTASAIVLTAEARERISESLQSNREG